MKNTYLGISISIDKDSIRKYTNNMMSMLPFRELECPDVEQISGDIWQFLNSHTNIMSERSVGKNFTWNFFSAMELVTKVPRLDAWFRSINLRLRDVAATVTNTKEGLVPHKDEPPVVAKINFPVINTRDTWNVWWDDEGREVGRIQMLKPLAFNGAMMHAVEMGPTCIYPRVVLSCMFMREPSHLLQVP